MIDNQPIQQEIEILIKTVELNKENKILTSSFLFSRKVIPLKEKLAVGLTWYLVLRQGKISSSP